MNNQGRTRSWNRNRSKLTSFTPRGSKQICIPMTRELYDEIWHDAEPVRALLERLIAESPEVFPDGIYDGYRLSGRLPESKKLPGIRLRQVRLSGEDHPGCHRTSNLVDSVDESVNALSL